MAPSTIRQSVQDLYDARASNYDDSHHPAFVKTFLQFLNDEPLQPGDTVLDLACGTGLVTFPLAEQVAPNGSIYALDISDGMLQVAMAKLKDTPNPSDSVIHFHNHSIDDLDTFQQLAYLKGKVDLITCASALVLLPDPAAALSSWASYLRPGTGRLLVDALPGNTMPAGLALNKVCTDLNIPLPYSRLWARDVSSFRELLQRNGHLVVNRCDFVPQNVTGRQSYGAGRAEAERQFERLAKGHMRGWFSKIEDPVRSQVKQNFFAEWAALANQDGFVEDLDGVFVALSRRLEHVR